jgi:hypothetical protein
MGKRYRKVYISGEDGRFQKASDGSGTPDCLRKGRVRVTGGLLVVLEGSGRKGMQWWMTRGPYPIPTAY